MWISILAFALLPQTVDGLKPGEKFAVGPPEAALGERECLRGRVIDGFTSRPLVEAEIELWTEGWEYPDGAIARGKTLVDGSFRIPHPGIAHVDKVLVRAKGYRSTTVATSDAQEVLLLPITKSLGLRVVDLEGKPIAGAHVESRQTCAHAPHAYVGTSDADGRFDLSTFPPLRDNPEMVVSARGYGAVFLGSCGELLLPGGFEVRLPRRKPIAFTVVDVAGKPLAHRRVSFGAEPEWTVQVTDDRGHVQFDSPFFSRYGLIQIESAGGAINLAAGPMPSSFEPRLVFVPSSADVSRSTSDSSTRIPVHLVDVDDVPVNFHVGVLHEAGSDLDATFIDSNWGRTTLFFGGPFTGYNEMVHVFEKPIEMTLRVYREPRLKIDVPENAFGIVHVQVADDSVILDQGPFILPIPSGGPPMVCCVNDQEMRLLRREQIAGDTRIDLSPDKFVVWSMPPVGMSSHYRCYSKDCELSISLATGWCSDVPVTRLGEFDVDPKAACEGRISAEGRVPRVIGPTTASLGKSGEFTIDLARRGLLKVRGPLRALFAGGSVGNALDGGGYMVSDLAPGPLIADIVRMDGSVVSVSLTLSDGEARELTLH